MDRLDVPGRQPKPYRVSQPTGIRRTCPVDGCPNTARTRADLRRHFMYRHPHDTLCILKEGRYTLPKCEQCGMHIPFSALNGHHQNSKLCHEGTDHRRQREAVADACQALEVPFRAKGDQLKWVTTFKYLGRPLAMTDDDWPAIYRNLSRARQKWGRFSRLLVREGANP